MKPVYLIIILTGVWFMATSCQQSFEFELSETGFKSFVTAFESKLKPLEKERNIARWDAYISGEGHYFDAADRHALQIDSLYQNQNHFEYLKKLKEENIINDPLLVRQLDILYQAFLGNQGDPELNARITELSSKISQKMINFRAEWDGKKYTDNEVTNVLKNERDVPVRKALWKAQKKVGLLIAGDLQRLVKMRNQKAHELGFDNFYEMNLTVNEQKPADVEKIFNELAALTDEPFKKIHAEIERIFAERYNIAEAEIRPWHYEDLFSQEAPSIFEINLDQYFEDVDIAELAKTYFNSFGMQVDTILMHSDLYEKEGKHQHAFSFCMDRGQDIRILVNLAPTLRWMDTMLHELGHAVYDKYIDGNLPYLLRQPAHAFTTEGIAMMFGGMASDPNWVKEALNLSDSEIRKIRSTVERNSRLSRIVFARWSLVMKFFEQKMYENPDQDLNKLWWDLVERYQYIKRPDEANGGEWAAKMHISGYPAYYHNYLLGELFAAQIRHYATEQFGENDDTALITFWHNMDAGNYLKEKIFAPGNRWYWNTMIEKASGEPLTPKYFVSQYIE